MFLRAYLSDHDHSYLTFNIHINAPAFLTELYLNFRSADWDMIRANLALIDWENVFLNCGRICELIYDKFKEIINNFIALYVPTYVKSRSNQKSPWFNSSLKRLTRTKQRKWNKYRRSHSTAHFREYRSYCRYVHRAVVDARSSYETNKFKNKYCNPSEFFKYIDKRTKVTSGVDSIMVGDNLISDSFEKANALNDHYVSVYTRDNGILPIFNPKMPPDSFIDIAITDQNIIKAIKKLNGSGAPGLDGISPLFIKNVFPYLVKPLKNIFVTSLSSGHVPSDWKKGIICPIYKNNGLPNKCSSYRPVCLTSIICKIFEYIVHDQLSAFLLTNRLISDNQHGFLAKRSTATNLIECMNDWTLAINDKKATDVMYIDMSKAFDTVSHVKLVYKLKNMGIGGTLITWISNYLSDRSQCVRVGSSFSVPSPVISGMPQGTVLGPLFFNIYMNDLNDEIVNSNLVLYADDSKIYKIINSATDCLEMAEDLLNLEDWVSAWQMKLNINKCELLSVGSSNVDYPYKLNGFVVPGGDVCRDLGVYVSDNLSFTQHCMKISRYAHYRRRQFHSAFACKDRDFHVFLFCTYVRPILESNSSVWSPHTLMDIDRIENVQRTFTKYLPGLYNMSYASRMNILNLESLEYRRIKVDLVFLFKIVNNLVHIDSRHLFSFNTMNTRGHGLKINHQYSRVNCRKYFFINRIVPVWNVLPSEVVNVNNVNMFKNRLKNVDLTRYCRGRAHTAI